MSMLSCAAGRSLLATTLFIRSLGVPLTSSSRREQMDKNNRPNDESRNGRAPHEGSDDDPVNEKPAGQSEFDDEIGYGKPPKKSQFKKGTSGNPKGRPKGSRNVGTLL